MTCRDPDPSADRLRSAALEAVLAPLVILDRAGTIVSVNAAWRGLAAMRGWALTGPWLVACAEEWDEPTRAALVTALREVQGGASPAVEVEYRSAWPAGEEQGRFLVRIGRLEATGTPLHLLVAHEDLTAARRAEEALRQARRLTTWGQLAGGVAHDFNNVLTGIVGYCELALAALPRESPARQEVEQIQRAGTQAMGLVRQLLRFGRRTPAEPRLVDVAEVLRGVGPLLDHLLGGQIELTIAAAEGQLVVIDPTQLEQVVMNLAINARDAMPGGGRLWIEAGPTGADELTLTVRDTGSGIPAEVLPRVFEPLFTTKGSEAGTGLGLATVQEIVRQAGGRVEVESRLGVGTTFRVRLPLARGSDPSGPAMLGA